MYSIIKAMYSLTESCIDLNGVLTDWFLTLQGVRQGDNMSPTMFALYINDLAINIKEMNYGVQIGDENISVLLYADDIVLVSETEYKLQEMLNFFGNWALKWAMSVNIKKSKVVHFRTKNVDKSEYMFKINEVCLDYVMSYKYLSIYFDEFLNFSKHEEEIARAGLRSLGSLIGKYKRTEYMGYETYSKYLNSNVCSVLDYGCEVLCIPKPPGSTMFKIKL